MLSEQDLIAWLDETALPEERARINAELERDPELRRRLLQQVQMDHALGVLMGGAQAHERVKQSILTVVRGDESALKQRVLADTTFLSRNVEQVGTNIPGLWASIGESILQSLRQPAWSFGLAAVCVLFVAWLALRPVSRDEAEVVAIETPVRVDFPQGTTVFCSSPHPSNGDAGSFVPAGGDWLRIGNKGSGTITFADGTVLHLEPETEVRFQSVANSPHQGGKQLKLTGGSVSAIVTKQPLNLPLLIETPHALVTVVGTEFDLAVATNQTQLDVTSGLVKLAGTSTSEKLDVSAGETAVASPNAPPRQMRLSRNPHLWPFSSESPWNTPIGSGAKYKPVPGHPFLAEGPLVDAVRSRRPFMGKPSDSLRNIRVNGAWVGDVRLDDSILPKNLAEPIVFLQRARRYALELRDVVAQHDGEINATDSERTDLAGPGINAHATPAIPFGLSNLGGLIRIGEYDRGIRHTLSARVNRERLSGRRSFKLPGTTWPATGGDAPVEGFLNVGTLLAIPPEVDIRALMGETGAGYELARAMQDYGVYITGFGPEAFTLIVGEARLAGEMEDAFLNQLVPLLQVVVNNAKETPGGGGKSRRALAPSLPSFHERD